MTINKIIVNFFATKTKLQLSKSASFMMKRLISSSVVSVFIFVKLSLIVASEYLQQAIANTVNALFP